MFTNLTAGCKFAQREQRHLFQSEAKPESVPESALGSLDFFSGDEEAASAPADPRKQAHFLVVADRARREPQPCAEVADGKILGRIGGLPVHVNCISQN